jgi:hypothetical protein
MRTARIGYSLILLPLLVISGMLVALDCHELTFPNHHCSVCKLKNTIAGPFHKIHFAEVALTCRLPQDLLYLSEEAAPYSADMPLQPGRLVASPHTDRAPPTSS